MTPISPPVFSNRLPESKGPIFFVVLYSVICLFHEFGDWMGVGGFDGVVVTAIIGVWERGRRL